MLGIRTDEILTRNGLPIIGVTEKINGNFGTFEDSKKAPIHRWFQYPAGFSYKAVDFILKINEITQTDTVYDPFVGSGTTTVECKKLGIESIGTEAHPIVSFIAKTKLNWEINFDELIKLTNDLKNQLYNTDFTIDIIEKGRPDLLLKCYSRGNLNRLIKIYNTINEDRYKKYYDIYKIAVICTLRKASKAATGWPYIAPKKEIQEQDALKAFITQIDDIMNDLIIARNNYGSAKSIIIEGDSRKTVIEDNSIDIIFTSPPYLNNYDYADRTRLEAYFIGFANSWNDITVRIRDNLIMSATTQVVRSGFDVLDIVSDLVKKANPYVAVEIQKAVNALSYLRFQKPGKKSYDILVGQYFNDMTQVLQDCYRVLKPGGCLYMILGDSAPYGIHIPTEIFIGNIGLGLGFNEFSTYELRTRGNKWPGNTQRHKVMLKESILTLKKKV